MLAYAYSKLQMKEESLKAASEALRLYNLPTFQNQSTSNVPLKLHMQLALDQQQVDFLKEIIGTLTKISNQNPRSS